MLKLSSTSIISRIDMTDRGLSRSLEGPGAVSNGLTGIEMLWWNVSSFSIGTE
jgi:hypothetical protein